MVPTPTARAIVALTGLDNVTVNVSIALMLSLEQIGTRMSRVVPTVVTDVRVWPLWLGAKLSVPEVAA
jgi:hypothetical protein